MKISSFIPLVLFHLPWILFCTSPIPSTASEGEVALPGFTVDWFGNRSAFQAGDVATIIISLAEFVNSSSYTANFSLSIEGIEGNSSFVSSVIAFTEGDLTRWKITFVPILAGEFKTTVTEENSGITDSSLAYLATPGSLYLPGSIVSWKNFEIEFNAGEKAVIQILRRDAFGNHIQSTSNENDASQFTLSLAKENRVERVELNCTYKGKDDLGRIEIEFISVIAGDLLLHVISENQSLTGSPLSFRVKPGPADIQMSYGQWLDNVNNIKVFSRLEFLVHQLDKFGNPAAGLYPFDAGVVNKETNLSVPITDLIFKELDGGIQLLSFLVTEPGNFMLRVFDAQSKLSISNTSYEYSVFFGYCDGTNSIINGSGLVSSITGHTTGFSIYLEDNFHDPSPVELRVLAVDITRKNDTLRIEPTIFFMRDIDAADRRGSAAQSSAFRVIYTSERSGSYDIRIFCGNTPLNGGRPFVMTATAGAVEISKSSVVKYDARVRKNKRNEIEVQLLDSLGNRATSPPEKLEFDIVDNSSFSLWPFEAKGEGIYIGQYEATELGAYNMCVLYEWSTLSPCPFEVNIFNDDYFPAAKNDSVSVWEDESLAFDVTWNDYFTVTPIRLTISSMPVHGSLLQQGMLFRYTPFKGFFGVDFFSYTLSDINDNFAAASVTISVLCKPPQFISLPSQLQVTEDVIGPQFGGFRGFAIKYSDKTENISLAIRTNSGSIFLSPMPYSATADGEITVLRGDQAGRNLTLVGNVKALNSALESIQYLGGENFYGNDVMSLSVANTNGISDAQVTVVVKPVNDPPFIRIPKSVILEREPFEGVSIFANKSLSPFGIFIGDPDLPNFPENKSDFLVTLSLELSDGILLASLPAYLLGKVELKFNKSHQWQHLQAFVTISNHFIIRAKGLRFRATVDDCNTAMEKLIYLGSGPGSVLTVNVNDMGNYGQCEECEEGKSTPLQVETAVNLISRKRVNSITASLLGVAVVIEFVLMSLTGGALLFYICKCTNLLYRDRTPPPPTNTPTGRSPNSERWTQQDHGGSSLRRRSRQAEEEKSKRLSPTS